MPNALGPMPCRPARSRSVTPARSVRSVNPAAARARAAGAPTPLGQSVMRGSVAGVGDPDGVTGSRPDSTTPAISAPTAVCPARRWVRLPRQRCSPGCRRARVEPGHGRRYAHQTRRAAGGPGRARHPRARRGTSGRWGRASAGDRVLGHLRGQAGARDRAGVFCQKLTLSERACRGSLAFWRGQTDGDDDCVGLGGPRLVHGVVGCCAPDVASDVRR